MNATKKSQAKPTPVTIIGPNLANQSLGQFHVHAAGCRDIDRDPKRFGYHQAGPHMSTTITAWSDVAAYVYEDHMAEREPGEPYSTPDDYMGDFHFAPCVKLTAKEEA